MGIGFRSGKRAGRVANKKLKRPARFSWEGCATSRRTPEADLQRAVVQALRVALPRTAIIANVLAWHDGVRALFDIGWLRLFALEVGRIAARYRPGLRWQSQISTRKTA